MTKEFEYDVALSYASEQRGYVESVAELLKHHGIRVFYDRFEEANLWGKNLTDHLDNIFRSVSRVCVVFLSSEYASRMWTNYERRSAQARSMISSAEYLLPVRFDDTDISGLLPTVAYVDARSTSTSELTILIIEKLTKLSTAR